METTGRETDSLAWPSVVPVVPSLASVSTWKTLISFSPWYSSTAAAEVSVLQLA